MYRCSCAFPLCFCRILPKQEQIKRERSRKLGLCAGLTVIIRILCLLVTRSAFFNQGIGNFPLSSPASCAPNIILVKEQIHKLAEEEERLYKLAEEEERLHKLAEEEEG